MSSVLRPVQQRRAEICRKVPARSRKIPQDAARDGENEVVGNGERMKEVDVEEFAQRASHGFDSFH